MVIVAVAAKVVAAEVVSPGAITVGTTVATFVVADNAVAIRLCLAMQQEFVIIFGQHDNVVSTLLPLASIRFICNEVLVLADRSLLLHQQF